MTFVKCLGGGGRGYIFEPFPRGLKTKIFVSRSESISYGVQGMLQSSWENNELIMLLWTVQGVGDDCHYKLCPGIKMSGARGEGCIFEPCPRGLKTKNFFYEEKGW